VKNIYAALIVLFLSSTGLKAEDMRLPDDLLWSTIECSGKKVDLMVNLRTVAQPTLYINKNDEIKSIEFSPDACYSELSCVVYQGNKSVHFVESSCGNAYETYWIVDIDTFKKFELDYMTAKKAGIIDY